MSFSAIPNYREPISQKGELSRSWYQFFVDLWKGRPSGDTAILLPPSSPYTYTAPNKGFVIVQGGTVSLVQFSRDSGTNITTGAAQGCFQLGQGDSLVITYSAAPTITWVPL